MLEQSSTLRRKSLTLSKHIAEHEHNSDAVRSNMHPSTQADVAARGSLHVAMTRHILHLMITIFLYELPIYLLINLPTARGRYGMHAANPNAPASQPWYRINLLPIVAQRHAHALQPIFPGAPCAAHPNTSLQAAMTCPNAACPCASSFSLTKRPMRPACL